MDQLSGLISGNLKRVREEKKLSLDTVATLSGVSKSMLGQIERCEVNPTVSTMWKIANGLKISFSQFVSHPETKVELVDLKTLAPLVEDEGRVKIYPTFPFDSARRFELYSLRFEAGGLLATEPHLQGTQEFLTLCSGQLTVTVGEERFVVNAPNAIRFSADGPHSYENTGKAACFLDMVIFYPG